MKKCSIWKAMCTIIPISLKASPIRFAFVNVFGIAQSLLMGVNTVLLARFIDNLTASIADGKLNTKLVSAVCMYVLGIIGFQLLSSIFNYMVSIFLNICDGEFRAIYNQEISRLAPIEFEKTDTLDEIKKAEAGRNVAKVFVFHLISILDMVPPYIIFLGFYLRSLDPLLLLSVLAAFLPAIYMLFAQHRLFAKIEDMSAPIMRRYNGYKASIISKQCLKETRILGAYSFFMNKMMKELITLCCEKKNSELKAGLLNASINLFSLLGYLATLVLLIYGVLCKNISIGSFAAVYSSIDQFFGMVTAMVCGFIGETIHNVPAIENLVTFITKDKEVNDKQEDRAIECNDFGIRLENVSFVYPNMQTPSIRNISVSIPAYQHIAIVGENGAGKTTLTKLMMGLYKPSSGNVFIGGLDTKCYSDRHSFQKHISAVFQMFCRYQMTLADNVRISDMMSKELPETALAETTLPKAIRQSAETVMLSREFGGIDLSGGQWQQVAITRARFRKHRIVFLDEPTAAIDPMMEADIYRRFLNLSTEKTTIVVSHRLSSARLADRILVMQDGMIVEDGSHDELILHGGKYKDMWDAQAESYNM